MIRGIAPDGGLFMPSFIPTLPQEFFEELPLLDIPAIAGKVLEPYCREDIEADDLREIITDAFNFDSPLKRVDAGLHVLELFHGPTLAFKDFGARFLARVLSHFVGESGEEFTILVATSGDTGSAVASAFLGQPGIKVVLLYPSGMVSKIQEMQLTTMGGNIHALEVKGSFDDCQRLVKWALSDAELGRKHRFSSANSINIARMLPQMLYYFRAAGQLEDKAIHPLYVVPSGNLGNLTAGLIAHRMGLPASGFIAAVNANDSFDIYVRTGSYTPKRTIATLSNAMDVGDPSNIRRIFSLYDDCDMLRQVVFTDSISDEETIEAIRTVHSRTGYIMDPHGAVGWRALADSGKKCPAIILETAHPAKFKGTVDRATGLDLELPDILSRCMAGRKNAETILADEHAFGEVLRRL